MRRDFFCEYGLFYIMSFYLCFVALLAIGYGWNNLAAGTVCGLMLWLAASGWKFE